MRRQDLIQVPRLEPKELFEKRQRRDYARLAAYNQLLEQIFHRIYAASQLSGTTSFIVYSVPPFILGLPKLDMEDCIVYLVFQLRQSGYLVEFTWPNLLKISWKHHEASYITQQSPIIQAMIPTPPPPLARNTHTPATQKPKKQTPGTGASMAATARAGAPSVAFNEVIDLINNNGSSGTFSNPPRRAADYQPPATFVQHLERPNKPPSNPVTGSNSQVQGDVLADLWNGM